MIKTGSNLQMCAGGDLQMFSADYLQKCVVCTALCTNALPGQRANEKCA